MLLRVNSALAVSVQFSFRHRNNPMVVYILWKIVAPFLKCLLPDFKTDKWLHQDSEQTNVHFNHRHLSFQDLELGEFLLDICNCIQTTNMYPYIVLEEKIRKMVLPFYTNVQQAFNCIFGKKIAPWWCRLCVPHIIRLQRTVSVPLCATQVRTSCVLLDGVEVNRLHLKTSWTDT